MWYMCFTKLPLKPQFYRPAKICAVFNTKFESRAKFYAGRKYYVADGHLAAYHLHQYTCTNSMLLNLPAATLYSRVEAMENEMCPGAYPAQSYLTY